MPHTSQNSADSHIVILPDSDHQTLCVSLFGVVQEDDYRKKIYSTLKTFVESNQLFNLLIHYDPTFKGWGSGAAKLSFQSIIDHGSKTHRIAYVNAPDSKRLQVNLTRILLSGEVRFFETDELKNAISWVKS
jgi:hypothetical protein